ncbi:MAG: hypothetical protein ACPGRZ_03960 [Alphaproteobacteria bacterium]
MAVAFDPACVGPALLEVSSRLANSLGAELEALLLVDEDMSRFSELPFGRMFEPHSGKVEQFDSSALRSHRAGALARTRATLKRLADSHRVTCTLREFSAAALVETSAATGGELLVIASRHTKFGGRPSIDMDAVRIAVDSSRSVLLVSDLQAMSRVVVVVRDQTPVGERAKLIAEMIAASEALDEDGEASEISAGDDGVETLAARIESLRPTLLVIGLEDAEKAGALHDRVSSETCSVLFVRSPHPGV